MRAIDTNIIVRVLTNDHPVQAAKARDLIEGEPVMVSTTVMLETEWVLRSVYRLKREVVLTALRQVAGHPNIRLAERDLVIKALDLADAGLELADALHFTATPECSAFVTFDGPMLKAAEKIDLPVETL